MHVIVDLKRSTGRHLRQPLGNFNLTSSDAVSDIQTLADKADELINALRRN